MRTVPALQLGLFFISALLAVDAQSQSQGNAAGGAVSTRPKPRSGPLPVSDKARIERLQQLLKEQGEALENLRKAVGEQDTY